MALHRLTSITMGVPNVGETTPSNFLDLKDRAGNFGEYYGDMDCIIDDQLWTPEELEGAQGL